MKVEQSVTPENCRRIEFSLPSEAMNRDIRVVLILPPGFEEGGEQTYPFLYMLHGMYGPHDIWANMEPLRALLNDHPMVLATFDGDEASYYLDAPAQAGSRFTSFFFNELSPFVEAAFRGSGQRAITGLSMGGFGAFHYMLCRPDYFVSVSSLSGALRSLSDYSERSLTQLAPLLGAVEEGAAAYGVLDINERTKKMLQSGITPPPLFLACGSNDFLLGVNRCFRDMLSAHNQKISDLPKLGAASFSDAKSRRKTPRDRMEEKQIDYVYEETPGGHDFLYWNNASAWVGLFHWKQFQVGDQ